MTRRKSKPVATPTDLPAHGDCYKWALDWLLAHHDITDAFLVHGRPTRTIEPYCQFGHAWIELGEYVIDHDKLVHHSLYYSIGKINPEHSTHYPMRTAFKMMLQHKHYGPWVGVDAPVEARTQPTDQ